jgi:hypothetical protein
MRRRRSALKAKLHRAIYDAGLALARHYFHARGITRFIDEGHRGSGLGVSAAKTRLLERELERLENPLQKLNPLGFSAVRALCIFENEIAREAEPAAIIVLCELGELLRMVGEKRPGRVQAWREA